MLLPAESMEQGGNVQGIGEAKRVRQLLGQGERLMAFGEHLDWIAKQPQDLSRIDEAEHSRVGPHIEEGMRAVLLGVVGRYPLLQMHSS
jgi:hypothetical protein